MMKAVFFDLDGTLIDSDPYWVRSQETLVRSCGGEWSDTLADALQGAAFPETVRLLRGAGVDWDGDAIVRHLSDEVLRMERSVCRGLRAFAMCCPVWRRRTFRPCW